MYVPDWSLGLASNQSHLLQLPTAIPAPCHQPSVPHLPLGDLSLLVKGRDREVGCSCPLTGPAPAMGYLLCGGWLARQGPWPTAAWILHPSPLLSGAQSLPARERGQEVVSAPHTDWLSSHSDCSIIRVNLHITDLSYRILTTLIGMTSQNYMTIFRYVLAQNI